VCAGVTGLVPMHLLCSVCNNLWLIDLSMQESLQEVAVDAWTVWGLIVAVRCMIAVMVCSVFRCTLTAGTAGQSWAQIAAW